MPGWSQYATFVNDDETKHVAKSTMFEVAVVLAFVMMVKFVQGEKAPPLANLALFFPLLTVVIFLLHGWGIDACATVGGVIKGQLFSRLFTMLT